MQKSADSLLKLHIRKRNFREWLLLLMLLLPFMFAFFTEIVRLPLLIRYSMDAILFVLVFLMLRDKKIIVSSSIKPLMILVLIFFLYTLFTYLFNYQSVFYYIWGLRNTFSFYVAFFIFAVYLSQEEATLWLKILDVLFWIHFVLAIFQFSFLGVRQDYLGGLFGTTIGTNGYSIVFLCIVITKSLLCNFNGTEKPFVCILKCLAALTFAAMAEMKFFYIAFILMLILASVFTKFSKRKFVMIVVGIIGVAIGSVVLTGLFGFEGFMSWESIWEFATKENYSSEDDLNRFSAIFTLSKTIVTEPAQRLFGLGLGNCDTSRVAIFNTPFFQQYQYLHYDWFSSVMMFLETGIIGLVLYISFFVTSAVLSHKQLKKANSNKLFCQLAFIMSILCVIISFYNSSLKIYCAYMVYFVLSLPFIRSNVQSLKAE